LQITNVYAAFDKFEVGARSPLLKCKEKDVSSGLLLHA